MPLYTLGNAVPRLGRGAWVAPSADLIGNVELADFASVWFGAVLRADNTAIVVGEETNIQDGAICHSDPGFPLTIGRRVTVGHQAILHGCTLEDDCLVGMGARVLNGALIPSECIVGAGTLITEGKRFQPGSLIVGAPGRAVRAITDDERKMIRASAASYADRAARFAESLIPV